jgi:putative FmdB family regulatory protein
MPIYEYQCKKCQAHIEVIQKINDKAPAKCRKCGGRLEKQISAAAIQFKGSGFYVNDYARPGKNGKKSTASGEAAEKASSSDKSGEKSGDKGSDKSGSEKSGSKETSPVKKTSDSASSTRASSGE